MDDREFAELLALGYERRGVEYHGRGCERIGIFWHGWPARCLAWPIDEMEDT